MAACGPRAPLQDPAPWASEEGKQETRLGIAEKLLALNQPDKALGIIALARQDGVGGAEIDYLTARGWYLKGMNVEAEQILTKLVESRRTAARTWHLLGLVYADTKRPPEAIRAFTRATEIKPEAAQYWNNLGFLLSATGEYEAAVDALRMANKLDGNEPSYRRNLAFALFGTGKREAAYDVFSGADSSDNAHYNMGVAHELHNDLLGAKDHYTKALKVNPAHQRAQDAMNRISLTENSQ